MKKTLLAAGAAVALSYTVSAQAADNSGEYLSDWWHQSVNVVGSYHTRFGPQLRNDTYLEYEAFAKKDFLISMVMWIYPASLAATLLLRVSGTTAPRCLWKSNHAFPLIS